MDEEEDEESDSDSTAFIREYMRGARILHQLRNVGGGMEGDGRELILEENDEDDDDVEFGDGDEDAYMEMIEDLVWGSGGEEDDVDGELEDMDELD